MVGDLLIKLHPVCVLPAFFILPGTCMREAEPEPILFFFLSRFFKTIPRRGRRGAKKGKPTPLKRLVGSCVFASSLPKAVPGRCWALVPPGWCSCAAVRALC